MDYTDLLIKLGLGYFRICHWFRTRIKTETTWFKTCLVISIISCLLTIVSIKAAYNLPHTDHMNMDPLRLAAQIVSGIGFRCWRNFKKRQR